LITPISPDSAHTKNAGVMASAVRLDADVLRAKAGEVRARPRTPRTQGSRVRPAFRFACQMAEEIMEERAEGGFRDALRPEGEDMGRVKLGVGE
jgi:hypothetical protein